MHFHSVKVILFGRHCQHRLKTTYYYITNIQSVSHLSDVSKLKYVLAMFPYPSGRLHMGHLRVYTLSDVLSRYYRLKGHRVLHPIGWDAFGLPAENAAIEHGLDSVDWTYRNIEEMRTQLLRTGVNFDWDQEIFTCQPDYYRWTQWIFIQLYKHGFVRKAYSEVNWDPTDNTVLADEQVDENGRSWRSGAIVERRRLNQWVVDTPRYAKNLLDGLSKLESEWYEVAAIQKDLIGPCDVFRFLLPIHRDSISNASFSVSQTLNKNNSVELLDLRISDPKELCSAQFVLLTREHQIAREAELREEFRSNNRSQDYIILHGISVLNIVTKQLMPLVIFIGEQNKDQHNSAQFYMNSRLGNAKSSDPLEKAIAEKLGLSTPKITEMSAQQVLEIAERLNYGGYMTSRKLRDWVVSRQRAWGTPIPMVVEKREEDGNAETENLVAAVPLNQLPILNKQRGNKVSVPSFQSGWGLLETDTLDTFFDSSWYFLRYLDSKNQQKAFDTAIVHRDMPVDVYVGGSEHASLHLLYARFIGHFLHGLGMLPQPEPFNHFIPVGVVRSRSYRLASSGKYIPEEEVDGDPDCSDSKLQHKVTGESVLSKFEKMSKSKKNGVDPLKAISLHGTDLTRLLMLIRDRPKTNIEWPNPDAERKLLKNWLEKGVKSLVLYTYVVQRRRFLESKLNSNLDVQKEESLRGIYNKYVKSISIFLEVLRWHDMAVRQLLEMTKAISRELRDETIAGYSPEAEKCVHALVIIMQVFVSENAAKYWEHLREVPKIQCQPWCRPELSVEHQLWPPLDQSDTIDFLVVMLDSCFSKSVPRTLLDGLNNTQIEQYAREHCHRTFFQILEQKSLPVFSTSVERISGLCIVLNLKITDDVEIEKREVRAVLRSIKNAYAREHPSASVMGIFNEKENTELKQQKKAI